MANRGIWVRDPKLVAKIKLTPQIKESVTVFFNPLLEEYREPLKISLVTKNDLTQ